MVIGAHPLLLNPRREGLPIGTTVTVANGALPQLHFQKQPDLLLGYGVASNEDSVVILRDDLREIVGQGQNPLQNR